MNKSIPVQIEGRTTYQLYETIQGLAQTQFVSPRLIIAKVRRFPFQARALRIEYLTLGGKLPRSRRGERARLDTLYAQVSLGQATGGSVARDESGRFRTNR